MNPKPGRQRIVPATLVRGHRVASGGNGDRRFPGGTLAMQAPHFRERGLDLGRFYPATLNLSLAPKRYVVRRAALTLRQVAWHPTEPAEDFSFFDAAVRKYGGDWVAGLIYYPHPDTKPAHFQPPDLLEVLAETWIPDLGYGDVVELAVDPDQIEVVEAGSGEAG